MSKTILLYALFMMGGVFISSVSQILLKVEAMKEHDSLIKEYLNPRVVIAYGLLFAATIIAVISYGVIPLSMGPMIEATGYLFVSAFGVLILKEKMNGKKILALILILIGILIYSLLG